MLVNKKRGQAWAIGIIAVVVVVAIVLIFTLGGKDSSSGAPQPRNDSKSTYFINMSGDGFTPQTLTIDKGDTVVFENVGEVGIEPASDDHPTHTQYDGTSRSEHCENGQPDPEVFDACSPVQPGGTYEFTFNETGEWDYHDHYTNYRNEGTIIVE